MSEKTKSLVEKAYEEMSRQPSFLTHPYFPVFKYNFQRGERGILSIFETTRMINSKQEIFESLMIYGKIHITDFVKDMLQEFKERDSDAYSGHDFQKWVNFFSEEVNYETIVGALEEIKEEYLEDKNGRWRKSLEDKMNFILRTIDQESLKFSIEEKLG